VFEVILSTALRTVAIAIATCSTLAFVSAAGADAGDVLVRFRADAPASARVDARRQADVRREAGLAVPGLERVDPEPGVSAKAAAAALERHRGVIYAEPDRPRSAALHADDPIIGSQWGLARIGAPAAWDVTTGSPEVTVAVVDTGVDLDHPDLAANVTTGWDYVDDDAVPDDESAVGHGTHVAGIVGARGNDGVGVAGVAWTPRLMPLRVLDADGHGSISDEIEAFARAAATGVRVVNASLGGTGYSQAEHDAIAAASNVLFVATAGNDGSDDDVVPVYPCAYDLPNLICVTASDSADGRPSYANVGARTVDLAAPGDHIASTVPGGWGWRSGTSMAAPHVAGTAALLLAHRSNARPTDLVAALEETAAPLPAFSGRTVTGGRLDASAALAAVRATVAPAAASAAPARPAPASPPSADAPPIVPAPLVAGAAGRASPAPLPTPAKLKLRRATVRRGRLDLLAEITRRATGSIEVALRSHGRTARFDAPIRDGRVRLRVRLTGRQRRGGGIVSLQWRGTPAVRSATLRVRAANQPARLRIDRAAVSAGRLIAAGRISSRARGVVRLRLAYPAAGAGRSSTFTARIERGRWRLSAALPPAAREGGYLTLRFTGYLHARGGPMRGEQDARQVAGR
jgi:subtilisin family serine protease